jgi:hypothetical protein
MLAVLGGLVEFERELIRAVLERAASGPRSVELNSAALER